MRKVKIGTNGPDVGVVGLGCMGMSEFYGASDDAVSIEVIHRAIDAGANFLDTADMYGSGENERLVGRALQGRRERVVLATKFGIVRGEGGSFAGISGRPDYVREACDKSLSRLGVDVIDLYYQHRVDPAVPIEDTAGALADLVKAGKVKQVGLSEASAATLRRANAVVPIAALQSEYSLWAREPEDDALAACAEIGATFVAYSPLGRGFLTGQIKSVDDLASDDFRRMMPRFSAENFPKNLALVRKVEELAAARGVTPAELALAWVLSRAPHVVVIPGTRSKKRLDDNVRSADLQLTPRELETLDAAFPKGAAAGTRYPEQSMKVVQT